MSRLWKETLIDFILKVRGTKKLNPGQVKQQLFYQPTNRLVVRSFHGSRPNIWQFLSLRIRRVKNAILFKKRTIGGLWVSQIVKYSVGIYVVPFPNCLHHDIHPLIYTA